MLTAHGWASCRSWHNLWHLWWEVTTRLPHIIQPSSRLSPLWILHGRESRLKFDFDQGCVPIFISHGATHQYAYQIHWVKNWIYYCIIWSRDLFDPGKPSHFTYVTLFWMQILCCRGRRFVYSIKRSVVYILPMFALVSFREIEQNLLKLKLIS